MKFRIYWLIILAVLATGVQFCEKKEPEIGNRPGYPLSQIEEELKNLEMDFQILQKDNPPQFETTPFRFEINNAKKELEAGNQAAAKESLNRARAWMEDARVRYYELHKKSILEKESIDTGEELMAGTREFWRLAATHKLRGEMEVYDKYHRAAIEQGDLALLAFRVRRTDVLVIENAAREQANFLRKAGDKEKADEIQEQARAYIQDELDQKTNKVRECLSGKTDECSPEKLDAAYANFQEAEKKVEQLVRERNELAEDALKLFPGKISAPELSGEIADWKAGYQSYYDAIIDRKVQARLEEQRLKNDEQRKRREYIAGLNNVCNDAVLLDGSGIVIEETSMDFQGDKVIVKGRVMNGLDQPIHEAKVAVCHGIVSELKRVGPAGMQPGMTFGFSLELVDFQLRDIIQNNYRLPPHKLVLIYKDAQGEQNKVYRKY